MTDKEKIRKEVERLMTELIQEKKRGYSSDVDDACILELQNVLTYIDSLPEEPVSNDLEEAAKKLGQKYFPDEYNIWPRPKNEAKKAECAFMEGAQWQKKHMITKACTFLETYPYMFMGVLRSEMIEDFKKYIKGE